MFLQYGYVLILIAACSRGHVTLGYSLLLLCKITSLFATVSSSHLHEMHNFVYFLAYVSGPVNGNSSDHKRAGCHSLCLKREFM